MDDIFLPKLSQNLLENLDNEEYYDINIEVGNDPYVKVFRAHIIILNCRSPYLRRILSTNKKKNDGTLIHIKLPNISPKIFQMILRYIYGGRLSLEEYDTPDIIKILVAASELSLKELITYIQSFLIEKKSNWIEQNFNLIYQTSFENNTFLELQKYCNDLISKDTYKIFNLINFSLTPENLLVSLIQNNNHQVNEIQVWKYLLKWGFAQNPELPFDPTSLSKDDFITLRNTLQKCIPFIRFSHLTSREFLENVFPYREILSEELFIDLLKLFLNHDYKPTKKLELNKSREIKPKVQVIEKIIEPKEAKEEVHKEVKRIKSANINSKIITFQHAKLISKWIDKLDIKDEIKNSYEFKLILRGSRDGFSPSKFHEICDNQSRTISIVKVKESNEILGGYNPIAWKSDGGYSTTKDSFIFSFKNDDGIENHILSRVKDEFSISNNPKCGPSFGYPDLRLRGENFYNDSFCMKGSYERRIRKITSNFSVEELEVFKII